MFRRNKERAVQWFIQWIQKIICTIKIYNLQQQVITLYMQYAQDTILQLLQFERPGNWKIATVGRKESRQRTVGEVVKMNDKLCKKAIFDKYILPCFSFPFKNIMKHRYNNKYLCIMKTVYFWDAGLVSRLLTFVECGICCTVN